MKKLFSRVFTARGGPWCCLVACFVSVSCLGFVRAAKVDLTPVSSADGLYNLVNVGGETALLWVSGNRTATAAVGAHHFFNLSMAALLVTFAQADTAGVEDAPPLAKPMNGTRTETRTRDSPRLSKSPSISSRPKIPNPRSHDATNSPNEHRHSSFH